MVQEVQRVAVHIDASRSVYPVMMIAVTEGELPTERDLDALYRAEADGVFRTLYAFTGGRADIAEEATAEAFARAVAQRALRDPLAWIYRVAFRLAIDEIRRERRFAPEVERSAPPPTARRGRRAPRAHAEPTRGDRAAARRRSRCSRGRAPDGVFERHRAGAPVSSPHAAAGSAGRGELAWNGGSANWNG